MAERLELGEGVYILKAIHTTQTDKVQFQIMEGPNKGDYLWGTVDQIPAIKLQVSLEHPNRKQFFMPNKKELIKPK